MRNLMLLVEYDGTNYHGFQVQPALPTIQSELERAILAATSTAARVAAAGRTDTGVHAIGQVVSFKTESFLSEQVLLRALNAYLPDDIVVKLCSEVPATFHARFSARSRAYRYTILNRAAPTALLRMYSYHYRRPLNLESMQQASKLLIGERDFAAFATHADEAHSTVREVLSATWQRSEDWLYFDITANGFLPQMVRGIVGTLVWVGSEKIDVGGFHRIMLSLDRRLAGPTVPAKGLCFMSANY